MKYSILGFNQERVLALQGEWDGKIKKLDVIDLMILRNVADFMHRSKVIKHTIDDKVYFSIQYSTIIEDLPILDIKKQALRDRLDKMCLLGLLEKRIIKNQSGTWIAFRMGDRYEDLIYAPTGSEIPVQVYSNTSHNTNITNNTSTSKEIDKSISKRKRKFDVREDLSYVDESFAQVWNEWLDYKDEIKKQYKTQRGATTQYASLVKYSNGNIVLANAIVKISIEHSWSGFFALTDKQVELFLSNKSPYASNESEKMPTISREGKCVVIDGTIYR